MIRRASERLAPTGFRPPRAPSPSNRRAWPRAGAWLLAAALLAAWVGGRGGAVARADDADLSTPKAAALTFSKALARGDAAGAKAAAAGDPALQKVVDALADVAAAKVHLQQAVKDKFADKANTLDLGPSPEDAVKEINAASEKVTGDTATLSSGDKDPSPMSLKKGPDGKWKVDLALFKDIDARQLATLEAMSKAWKELTADLQGGKVATVEDFQKSLDQKTRAAALGTLGGVTPPSEPPK